VVRSSCYDKKSIVTDRCDSSEEDLHFVSEGIVSAHDSDGGCNCCSLCFGTKDRRDGNIKLLCKLILSQKLVAITNTMCRYMTLCA
jgi:hypothetical protein